ncbi:hypothetical protein Lspi_0671 [Legionella spiritensis]|uniref:Uncharacterized protein n=1 Tax=Legionella spiritensis TaxID=452 RepID=A0A0W0Z8H1_LEGSP|nr:hypothetical protein Lspi_0671 [Legionella spiritensis]SNV47333.1 Uncharacterised protein [Legionella spiritensis]
MGCLAEALACGSEKEYQCSKDDQKYFIEYILQHSHYDLRDLADILEVRPLLLSQVVCGRHYLKKKVSINLYEWFLITLCR